MLSRRTLFTLGLGKVAERVEEQFEAERPTSALPLQPPAPRPPPRVPARPDLPPPRVAWPHRRGAELWEPVSQALPRPAGARVLEADELEFDLARLPFADDEYDAVVSAFAPQFSSDGRRAIEELFRIVRPGGLVAFTCWTPAGIVGRLTALAEELDPPRAEVPSPLAWGRTALLHAELARHSDEFELRPGGLTLEFASGDQALDRLFAALRPLAWAPRRDELRRRAQAITGADTGAVRLRATYVMAVAQRRSA